MSQANRSRTALMTFILVNTHNLIPLQHFTDVSVLACLWWRDQTAFHFGCRSSSFHSTDCHTTTKYSYTFLLRNSW